MGEQNETQLWIQRAKRDQVFTTTEAHHFAFGDSVAEVFDDMISRSVPGYLEVQLLMSSVASKFCLPEERVYDLGCSTATSLALIAKRLPELHLNLIGIDSSESMLAQAKQKLEQLGLADTVTLLEQDLCAVELESCRVVALNYTLQFIAQDNRLPLLESVAQALLPGGVLVLSEKVALQNNSTNELVRELHEDFKILNGYSAMEVARKRESLSGVLVPYSVEQNEQLLQQAGFRKLIRVFQGFEFYTWLALK